MKFHTFGEEHAPIMLLIHGMLTPWQIWGTQIAHFCRNYYVIAIALDAHTEEERSDYISPDREAANIEAYLKKRHMTDIYAVCGISMGGVVAHQLWKNQNIHIRKLILDGAPLLKIGKLPEFIMTRNYLRIIAASRRRDPKVMESFKRDFLPEQYLESYLKIADLMTADSIKNAIASVCRAEFSKDVTSDTKILFIHGTKGNEAFSQKAAQQMQKYYPEMQLCCLEGCKHCEYAIYQPNQWIRIVEEFLASNAQGAEL